MALHITNPLKGSSFASNGVLQCVSSSCSFDFSLGPFELHRPGLVPHSVRMDPQPEYGFSCLVRSEAPLSKCFVNRDPPPAPPPHSQAAHARGAFVGEPAPGQEDPPMLALWKLEDNPEKLTFAEILAKRQSRYVRSMTVSVVRTPS